MNFLKNAGRGIPAVEINKLDLIIERCVKKYEKGINECFLNSGIQLTDDQILVNEEAIISKCLEKYDNEACEFMGRKINKNWKEGGGDNLEIRKRILFRKLTEMKGQLMAKVHELRAKLDSFLAYIQIFEKMVVMKVPLNDEQLAIEIDKFPIELAEILKPYTFESMNTLVDNQLRFKRDSMFENIKNTNAEVIKKTIDQTIQKTIHRSKIMADLAVRRAVQSALGNIKKSAPSTLESNILRALEEEITYKATKCCFAFKTATYRADNEQSMVNASKDTSSVVSPEDFHKKAIIAAGNLISASLQDSVESLITELKDSNPLFLPPVVIEDLQQELQYKVNQSSVAFLEANFHLRNDA